MALKRPGNTGNHCCTQAKDLVAYPVIEPTYGFKANLGDRRQKMASTANNLEREAIEFETSYWEAVKAGDLSTLRKLTADNFILVTGDGLTKLGKDEFVKMIGEGDYKLWSYKIDERQAVTSRVGKDTVVVAYKVHQNMERGGRREEAASFNASTLVKEGNDWSRAAHTISPIS
jgi:ketosteroid isomerase-like protein